MPWIPARRMALLITVLGLFTARRLPRPWRAALTWPRGCFAMLALLLVVIGVRSLRFSSAVSSLEWGLIFNVGLLILMAIFLT